MARKSAKSIAAYFAVFTLVALAGLAASNYASLFTELAALQRDGLPATIKAKREALWDLNPLRCFHANPPPGAFLFYCHTTVYNEYEHGAYYFGLEPEAVQSLKNADVVFLGNSRLQHAFSTAVTDRFAQRDGYKYYLLGMGYVEGSEFFRRLFEKLDLHPKVLVINVDPFFDRELSAPAASVIAGAWYTHLTYRWKRWFQARLPQFCGYLPAWCTPPLNVVYRERSNGQWLWRGYYFLLTDNSIPIPENYGLPLSPNLEQQKLGLARAFFRDVGVSPRCVIVTSVPSEFATPHFAQMVASDTGAKLIEPSAKGLFTLEKSHLRYESAEIWSAAFLEQASARIKECLAAR